MSNTVNRKEISKIAEKIYKDTNFTKVECENLLRILEFEISKKPHKKLDRSGFRNILHKTFRMTDDMLLDRIFRAFDQDMDGVISPKEWVKAMSIFLLGSLKEKTKFAFCVYDLNSDGLISREEMFQLLKPTLVRQPTEEDPDEGTKDLVDMTFKKFDVDHDGKLTFQNFADAVENEPLLLEGLGPCLPEEKSAAAFLMTFQESEIFTSISYLGNQDRVAVTSEQ